MADRKLVLDEGSFDDWYVLHEEPYRRINGADIEGTAEEWRAIAAAIDAGERAGFKRCAVNPYSDGHWDISSPRNSTNATVLTPSEAKALVVEIRRVLDTKEAPMSAVPTTPVAPRCSCTHEAGDSDCAAHPTCSECGADLAHQRVVAERDALGAALDTISAIRDSIVGSQSVNWSEHVYPLVAALDATGRKDTVTRSEAWALGDGSAVVLLAGKTGGCALTHIEIIEEADRG